MILSNQPLSGIISALSEVALEIISSAHTLAEEGWVGV